MLIDNNKNKDLIFTSYDHKEEYIKVFYIKGNFKENITDSNNEENVFIDTYSDKNYSKYYLISRNSKSVKIFDLDKKQLYYNFYYKNSD